MRRWPCLWKNELARTPEIGYNKNNGKHRLGSNISIPLKAICILTRDTDNHIEPVTREQAYPILLQQTYRPKDRLKTIKTLTLINKLADQVKLYLLGCNMDISAAKISFEGMSNE